MFGQCTKQFGRRNNPLHALNQRARTKGIENHHNFQAHSIEDLPEDYLPTEDSYYEFEPEDVNKENLSIAEMSGKKLDWFRKVCAAVL